MSDDDVVKFAAVLDEFSAQQRALAIGEVRKVRIIASRTLGGGGNNVSFECVVDQDAERAEYDALLDKMADAGDRQEARNQLDLHMRQLRLELGNLNREKENYARRRQEMEEQNIRASADRRRPLAISPQQRQELDRMRVSLGEAEGAIEERRLTIEECKRIINGQTRLEAVVETQKKREEAAAGKIRIEAA